MKIENNIYYLWKDKRSTIDKLIVYITDYREISTDGKVKIDDYGYLDAELLLSSNKKSDLIEHAKELIKK
jgi:hypothetical protein